MLGFLKKAQCREHLKLVYQNSHAVNYIAAFDAELASTVSAQTQAVQATWVPGELLEPDHALLVLKANKALRKAYDQTPGRFTK